MNSRRKIWSAVALAVVAGSIYAGIVIAQETKSDAIDKGEQCQMNAIERSICIYEAILADISANYPHSGGGGISGIKQTTTTSFTVSISQEERKDLRIYEIGTGDDGAPVVLSVETSEISRGG